MTAAATPTIPVRIVVDQASINNAVKTASAKLSTVGQGNGANAATGAIQRLTVSLGGAGNAAARTAANTNTVNSAFGSMGATAQAAASRLAGMGGVLGGIGFAGAALGATALVGGLVALGTAAVNASAKMEGYRASLVTILGDADRAGMAMDRLSQFAASTPFSLDQAVQGFIKMRALGLKPTEAAMTSLGNFASVMGKSLNDAVEMAADASTGEFERMKEFGVKAKQEGDKVSLTFQGVTTTIGNNATEIMKYIEGIGNTQFAGAMARQMETFEGAMSNLEDTWFQTMAAIGDAGLNKSMGAVITLITDGLTSITPLLVGVGNAMSGLIDGVVSIVSGVGEVFSAINQGGGSGVTLMENLTFHFNMIGQVAQVAGAIIGGVFSAMGTLVSGAASILTGTFGQALDWLGISFETGSRSWTNSLFGILRAAKVVALQLPQIFKIAVNDLMGMFSTLGQAIGALLTGQWDKAKALASKPLFTNTQRALDATGRMGAATYRDEGAADAAMNRMLGRTNKKEGLTLDQLAGNAPKTTPTADADKDAAKKAADRAKRENDFWEQLKQQATAAGMLTLQAEAYNKQGELRKVLERELTDSEKGRVASALAEINNAKAITTLRQRALEASNEYTVELTRAAGLTETQRKVEDDLFKYRIDAKNRGVDIDAAAYKQAEADLRLQLEKNEALKEQNAYLAKAGEFARRYSSALDISKQLADMDKEREAFDKAWNANGGVIDGQTVTKSLYDSIMAGYNQARADLQGKPLIDALGNAAKGSITAQASLDRLNAGRDYNEQSRGLNDAYAAGGLSKEEFDKATREIARTYGDRMRLANNVIADHFTDEFTDGIDAIADRFGGAFGRFLEGLSDLMRDLQDQANPEGALSKFAGLFGKDLKAGFDDVSSKMMLTPDNLKSGFEKLGNPIGDLKDAFGKNGSITKGIGQAVGGAMAGYAIGDQMGGLMEGLGLKNSSTGAKIGGTIGGLTGNPLIAAGASVVGGLIGSLFHKPEYGTAALTGTDPAIVTGRKSGNRAAAGSAAESVQNGLADIADRLGGAVGEYSLAIGQWDGKWRVNTNATTKALHSNNFRTGPGGTLTDFGKDGQAAAIEFAIRDAIKDGAITGLSDLAQKAIAKLDVDKAISLAEAFKTITDELDAMSDPLGAEVRNINNSLDSLVKQMNAVGASSGDLAKVEQYRSKRLNEVLKEQLSGITDFIKMLNGEGSGATAVSRLEKSLEEFRGYQSRIAAGDNSVDQSAFTALGQEIFGLARDVYGTSTQPFQEIRDMLTGAAQGMIGNITTAFGQAGGDTTTAAIEAQTSALVGQQVITNDLLKQLLEKQGGTATPAPAVGVIRAQNGQIVDRNAIY